MADNVFNIHAEGYRSVGQVSADVAQFVNHFPAAFVIGFFAVIFQFFPQVAAFSGFAGQPRNGVVHTGIVAIQPNRQFFHAAETKFVVFALVGSNAVDKTAVFVKKAFNFAHRLLLYTATAPVNFEWH